MLRNRYAMAAAGFVMFSCLTLVAAASNEPLRPAVDTPLDGPKEEMISKMTGLSADEVFERLKGMEFFLDDGLSARTIYLAFGTRKGEILARAVDSLKAPVSQVLLGRLMVRSADIVVARRIFEVFPEEAVPTLLELYGKSDAIMKGNILRVSGRIAGGDSIRKHLISALDDRTPCEEENPEVGGEPLRLCDMAYNQLVLRYGIKDVLRAIGPVYRIEVRDYHIEIMKDLMGSEEPLQ